MHKPPNTHARIPATTRRTSATTRVGALRVATALNLTILTLAFFGAFSGIAQADPITFQVVNSRGVPQASVYESSSGRSTDPNGNLTIDASAGQALSFQREHPQGYLGEGCTRTPPVSYTVPSPAPSSATITLPAFNYPGAEPQLSISERKLIGLINDERRKRGVPPAQVSTVLSSAADSYSNHLGVKALVEADHCRGSTSEARQQDVGWPAPAPVENLGHGSISAATMFKNWMDDPGHRETMIDPRTMTFGVGRAPSNSTWVLDMAPACPTEATARCGLTNDFGDSSLDDGGSTSSRKPSLKIYSVKRSGRKVTLKIKIRTGEGKLKVSASRSKTAAEKRAGTKVKLTAKGKRTKTTGNVQAFKVTVPNNGKWKIAASLDGKNGWADKKISKTVTVTK